MWVLPGSSEKVKESMIYCRLGQNRYVSFRLPTGHGYTGLVNKAGRWADDLPKLLPGEAIVAADEATGKAVSVVFDLPDAS